VCSSDLDQVMSSKGLTTRDAFAEGAEKAAKAERDIQAEIDRKEKSRAKGKKEKKRAM